MNASVLLLIENNKDILLVYQINKDNHNLQFDHIPLKISITIWQTASLPKRLVSFTSNSLHIRYQVLSTLNARKEFKRATPGTRFPKYKPVQLKESCSESQARSGGRYYLLARTILAQGCSKLTFKSTAFR